MFSVANPFLKVPDLVYTVSMQYIPEEEQEEKDRSRCRTVKVEETYPLLVGPRGRRRKSTTKNRSNRSQSRTSELITIIIKAVFFFMVVIEPDIAPNELLKAGDIEQNPGPMNCETPTCTTSF